MASFRGEQFFLSNFFPCSQGVEYEGVVYPTSEHAFVAAKTTDPKEREVVGKLFNAAAAKRYGKTLVLRPDWTPEFQLGLMEALLRSKFTRNLDLRAKLLATGEEQLVEVNEWHDHFWGVCQGIGRNNLGKLLMKIREELKQEV